MPGSLGLNAKRRVDINLGITDMKSECLCTLGPCVGHTERSRNRDYSADKSVTWVKQH